MSAHQPPATPPSAAGSARASDLTRRRLAQALEALSAVQLELDDERLRHQAVEELFEGMLASMPDAVLLLDARALVTRANRAAKLLFARDTAELTGLRVADLFDRSIPASPWELLEAVPDSQTSTEAGARQPDGTVVPVSLSAALLRDRSGKVDGAVYVARDLSGTHRLLHEVEAARARWRLLVEVGDRLHRELDPADSLPEVIDAVAAATGWGVALLLTQGAEVTQVLIAPPDGPAREAAALRGGTVRAGTALELAIRAHRRVHARRAATDLPVLRPGPSAIDSFVLAPVVSRGTSLGALLVAADQPLDDAAAELAEQLASRLGLTLANARLRAAVTRYEAVQEANRLREQVVAGISHDLRTPLTVLLASLESLRDHPTLPDGQRQDLLAGMERQARQLQRLVRQFLDYTRLEAGHPLDLSVRPVALDELLRRVADDFRGKAAVVLDIPAELPAAVVDPARFEQAVSNVVASAVQFAGAASAVTISAHATADTLEVAVASRGPGIAPEDLPHLFDRFRTSQDAARGGVGLFLSKRLLEGMGGSVTATSRVGEGTRLVLRVPAAGPASARSPERTELSGTR